MEKEVQAYLDRALVTGKADSSNLADHILKKIDSGLQVGIEKYVNGHLREIKGHLKDQDGILLNIQSEQGSMKMKLDNLELVTKPAVKSFDWIMTFGKVALWVAMAITAIGGALFMVIKLTQMR